MHCRQCRQHCTKTVIYWLISWFSQSVIKGLCDLSGSYWSVADCFIPILVSASICVECSSGEKPYWVSTSAILDKCVKDVPLMSFFPFSLLLLSLYLLVYHFIISTLYSLFHLLLFYAPPQHTLLLNHPSQHKRHAQTTTKYVELIIVADNREVSRGPTVSTSSPSSADLHSKGV